MSQDTRVQFVPARPATHPRWCSRDECVLLDRGTPDETAWHRLTLPGAYDRGVEEEVGVTVWTMTALDGATVVGATLPAIEFDATEADEMRDMADALMLAADYLEGLVAETGGATGVEVPA